MTKKLSVLIPVYNEANTIAKVLQKVCNVKLSNSIELEIIIVNDASTDQTVSIIKAFIDEKPEHKIKLVEHSINLGKGAGIRTGIASASGDIIIVQDADLEYDPNEYNELLQPILDGHADVVYGSRFMGSKPHRILFFWHSIGNRFLTTLSNAFNNLNLTDMETGFKMFKSDIIKRIEIKENRFGFEPEITAKISRIKGIKLYEVGISYYGRTYQDGKKIRWTDGIHALYAIVKYGLRKN
ncbi:glycosyltransferase [bacterium]|nr:glycosyltransferase [bacterium]